MSDVGAAVNEAVWDAIAVVATPGTLVTGLIVAAFFLGAQVLSEHRQVAAALRVAGLLTVLTGLMLAIHRPGWVTELDTVTTSWVVAHRPMGFDVAALVITDLGSPVATAAAAVICAALLSWRARSRVPGIVVIGTVSAAALASTALKAVVDRPRPPLQWQLVLETDPSFPSGHVTGTAALLGITAVCVGMGRNRTVRAWLAGGVSHDFRSRCGSPMSRERTEGTPWRSAAIRVPGFTRPAPNVVTGGSSPVDAATGGASCWPERSCRAANTVVPMVTNTAARIAPALTSVSQCTPR
ncbi:MAG TPA: hypothetical protein VF926_11350 [Mycobacterium sp.]